MAFVLRIGRTFREWFGLAPKPASPTVAARPRRSRAVDRPWQVELPTGGGPVVYARTRSEARAVAKSLIGIPRKGRLPVGTWVYKSLPW